MRPDKQRPVTVEDLLRLKRAERPADDFWSDFDRQLRAKQLAALVEKRPWWHEISLPGLLAGLRRYHLPLGATAVLLISFVSYRTNQSPAPEAAQTDSSRVEVPESVDLGGVVARRVESNATEVVAPKRNEAEIAKAMPESRRTEASLASAPVSGDVSGFTAFLGATADESSFVSPASSVWPSDSGWSNGSMAEPVRSRSLLATTTRFEARTLPSRPVIEPLRQITPPSERRGARILTAMVSMASVESAMRTTERAASRLSEEQLYEQIRRVGAFGAGVNVKF